jgi:hypothetical protein
VQPIQGLRRLGLDDVGLPLACHCPRERGALQGQGQLIARIFFGPD